jgi:hypothetical protein
LKLKQAQDYRQLSDEERNLRAELKMKCLGLTSLGGAIAQQRSRVLFLHEGDACTRFFHLHACHGGRKSFIDQLLVVGDPLVIDEEEMTQAAFNYFDGVMGASQNRAHSLDFGLLGLPSINTSGLDHCFSQEEVWVVNLSLRVCQRRKHPIQTGSLSSSTIRLGWWTCCKPWQRSGIRISEVFTW